MTPWQHAGSAAAAALLISLSAPAEALPPTTRTVDDPTDSAAAYDITSVVLRAAPKAGRPAVVLVKHAREVAPGDVVDVWFDLDGDKTPDLHLVGYSFSEFVVFEADSFDSDGRNVSVKDCVRLSMAGTTSKVRVFPECLDDPRSFAVSVRSSVSGRPARTDDWTPRTERFTRKVLAAPVA